MRFWSFLATIILISTTSAQAQAQTLPPLPGRPIPMTDTYTVRTTAITPIMQIVVQGRASLRVPADGLRIDAVVFGISDPADNDKILARLRAGGLDDPQILAPSNFGNGNASTIVRATLRRPTPQRIEALEKLTAAIVSEHPALKLQNVSLSPFVDDCGPVESKLRHAAIDDARRRALDIAQAASVNLGGVTSVSEPASPCPLNNQGGSYFNNGLPGLEREPALYLSMVEGVTFAIAH